MSRSLLTLASALLLPAQSSPTQFIIRAPEPYPTIPHNLFRPACHTKPHEPPARILNAKKRRKK